MQGLVAFLLCDAFAGALPQRGAAPMIAMGGTLGARTHHLICMQYFPCMLVKTHLFSPSFCNSFPPLATDTSPIGGQMMHPQYAMPYGAHMVRAN